MKILARQYKLEELKGQSANLNEVYKNVMEIENPELKKLFKSLVLGAKSTASIRNFKVTHKPSGKTTTFSVDEGEKVRDKLREVIRTDLIRLIRDERAKQRESAHKVVYAKTGETISTVGGVFTEPGQILKAMNFPDDPYTHKVPKLKNVNYFGVELEFNSKGRRGDEQTKIAEFFKANKLAKYVCVASDHCGHELKLLLPENNFKVILKQVLDYLVKEGYVAGDDCGMHVHIDMRNRDQKLVYKNLFKFQNMMLAMVPKKRRQNRFCVPNSHPDFDSQTSRAGSRYHVINTLSFTKHQTLEVRLHHGTLDYHLASNWLKLLMKIANLKEDIDVTQVDKIEDAKKYLKLRDYEVKTLDKRIKAFA